MLDKVVFPLVYRLKACGLEEQNYSLIQVHFCSQQFIQTKWQLNAIQLVKTRRCTHSKRPCMDTMCFTCQLSRHAYLPILCSVQQ